MKQFVVQESFWNVFPDAEIQVLVVKGISNEVNTKEEYFYALLKESKEEAKQFLGTEPFSQNPVVAEWREAFRQFKTKKGARSSIEALLKRVDQGREFTPINPLVDLYNSVSLKFGVPCGGEDLESLQGNIQLRKAEGGEHFLPLGASEDSPALPDEIIYRDDEGAVCRCLNWREAQRTMLTEETHGAVLVIESINEDQSKRAREAAGELQKLVDRYFNTTSEWVSLTREEPSAVLVE